MNNELTYQRKKIFYRALGKGKTVMLIHGFGEDGTVWKNQMEFLRDKFRLIIPDLPGSGRSEKIDDMSIEGMAEVIKAILDAEFANVATPGVEAGRACLVGHSMGGYILLAMLEKYPTLVNAVSLFHSTAYADSEEMKRIRRKAIDFIERHGAFEFLKATRPNHFSPESKIQIPHSIGEIIDIGNNFSPLILVSYYEAMMRRPDRTVLLRKATVPVLFILGEHDTAVPLREGLKQCHLPEKSYIHILRQSGHMGMLEEAERCNGILEKFLREP